MRYLLLVASLVLAGCASGPKPPPEPAITVLEGERALPSPYATDGMARGTSQVGPLDVLSFDVFGIEQISRERIQVGPGGAISFPLIGSIDADGMTIEELEAIATQRLRQAGVRAPKVAINFVEVESQFVTVEGEVNKPGLFEVRRGMTLLRAVAAAEGMKETAELENVIVFRTVGNRKMAALYNLEAIRLGYYEDPALYSGDVVVVNQDRAALLFQNALGILPALTYVVVAFIN